MRAVETLTTLGSTFWTTGAKLRVGGAWGVGTVVWPCTVAASTTQARRCVAGFTPLKRGSGGLRLESRFPVAMWVLGFVCAVLFSHELSAQSPSVWNQASDASQIGVVPTGGKYNRGRLFHQRTGELVVVDFSENDGLSPQEPPVETDSGLFFGVTPAGGDNGVGTLYSFCEGTLRTVAVFRGNTVANQPARPSGGLVHDSGYLYGVSSEGGCRNLGTLFRATAEGAIEVLVEFNGMNGARPCGTLAVGADDALYGTTTRGGDFNFGTLFKVSPSGALTTLAHFRADANAGVFPCGRIVCMGDGTILGGTILGVSSYGGPAGAGALFAFAGGELGLLMGLTPEQSQSGFGLAMGPDQVLRGFCRSGHAYAIGPEGQWHWLDGPVVIGTSKNNWKPMEPRP